MKSLKIGFIGCGKMAQALAKGFIAGGNCFLNNIYQVNYCFDCYKTHIAGITKAENIIGSSPRADSMYIEEFSASFLLHSF